MRLPDPILATYEQDRMSATEAELAFAMFLQNLAGVVPVGAESGRPRPAPLYLRIARAAVSDAYTATEFSGRLGAAFKSRYP